MVKKYILKKINEIQKHQTIHSVDCKHQQQQSLNLLCLLKSYGMMCLINLATHNLTEIAAPT